MFTPKIYYISITTYVLYNPTYTFQHAFILFSSSTKYENKIVYILILKAK